LALQKGHLGNRLLYGSSYTQSVLYLVNDTHLLSTICNNKKYVPPVPPSRETVGSEDRECNNDCDCYGLDTCNTDKYICNSSLKVKLNPPGKCPSGGITLSNSDDVYKALENQQIRKINERPVNSYACNHMCNLDSNCDIAIYNRGLQSCYAPVSGNTICTTADSGITSTTIM